MHPAAGHLENTLLLEPRLRAALGWTGLSLAVA